jgi:hypothetical protein
MGNAQPRSRSRADIGAGAGQGRGEGFPRRARGRHASSASTRAASVRGASSTRTSRCHAAGNMGVRAAKKHQAGCLRTCMGACTRRHAPADAARRSAGGTRRMLLPRGVAGGRRRACCPAREADPWDRVCMSGLPMTSRCPPPQMVAFESKNPRAARHLLIVPRAHIRTINDILPSDGPLIRDMRRVGERLLDACVQKAGRSSQASVGQPPRDRRILGFHTPPFHSIDHLHLHCIELPFTQPFAAWRYSPRSLWFLSVDSVLARM